jgi:putative RecB family exonuclease
LAFRFSYVEHREQPPQISATKGTIVHRALELLYVRAPQKRTLDAAQADLDQAFYEYSTHRDLTELHLNEAERQQLVDDAHVLVEKYFELETPSTISPVGLELKLEAPVGSTLVRGIIDRLELDSDGNLVVTDYKTGAVPRESSEHSRLSGVHLYSLLCEKVFGILPAKVQLLYLSQPAAIIATPSPSSVKGAAVKSSAISVAVQKACDNGDFRPNPSVLCGWCGYRDLCPAQGGKLPDA